MRNIYDIFGREAVSGEAEFSESNIQRHLDQFLRHDHGAMWLAVIRRQHMVFCIVCRRGADACTICSVIVETMVFCSSATDLFLVLRSIAWWSEEKSGGCRCGCRRPCIV